MAESWRSLFRVAVGAWWLYFASQKWFGVGWMRPLIEQSARTNPVPGLHPLLVALVVPNWQLFAVLQAVGETAVAVLLVLGLLTRLGALAGTLLALNLSLTVAFLQPDPGLRTMYYLGVLVDLEILVNGPGRIALDALLFRRRSRRAT